MKAPVTTPSVRRCGYPGNSKTADRKKFTERYYEWTCKTLEKKYGRVDHAEDAFTDLINDILKTHGIHRNDKNRGYKYHTLIINRAKGCFWRIAAKVWNKAHVRYVESEQALGQPSRDADAVTVNDDGTELTLTGAATGAMGDSSTTSVTVKFTSTSGRTIEKTYPYLAA